MAHLNGKVYLEWKEYIKEKFPDEYFNISIESNNSVITYIVTSKGDTSKTKIYLELIDNVACRVTFNNPSSPLSIQLSEAERKRSLLYKDYILDDVNLSATENYIDIPLHFGWTDRQIYYKNQLLTQEILYNNTGKWISVHMNTYYWKWLGNAGCLLFPVVLPGLWLESKIVRNKIRNGKEIRIESKEIPAMVEP